MPGIVLGIMQGLADMEVLMSTLEFLCINC